MTRNIRVRLPEVDPDLSNIIDLLTDWLVFNTNFSSITAIYFRCLPVMC